MSLLRRRPRRSSCPTGRRAVAGLAVLASMLGSSATARPAAADTPTVSHDTMRSGWDPDEPQLSPSSVAGSDFGPLFATPVDGQVYAEPLVAGGVVVVATETNRVYGLDPATGAVRWTRSDLGPAWLPSAIGCGDLTPNIGITSTPTYDPATRTVYAMAKVNDGVDVQHPHWRLHAMSVDTGAERSGWPVTIQGSPANNPTHPFDPFTAMQRPGLLLLDGRVYAGFGAHCDYGAFVGYVVGVDTRSAAISGMWSTETGSSYAAAGIWQSGGGLVSDGPGRILLATGNGVSPPTGPGSAVPGQLAESVVRIAVASDGSLSSADFFSPTDDATMDANDTDLGSGAPMALPAGFGTPAHPRLMVEVGKDGRVFLLDRDHLGGKGQGPGGADDVVSMSGPYQGVWGAPAVWPGDGGYVYSVGSGGPLRALKYGVSGTGVPTLISAGTSQGTFGYSSGSPVVTSDGTASGTALVWLVYSDGSSGSGGQLRAYDAVPVNGVLTQRYAAPLPTVSKFSQVASGGGRLYVGTRDGHVYGFGRPQTAALQTSPVDLGSTAVGSTASGTATVTATRDVTVTGVSTTAPFAATSPGLPLTLTAGQQVSVPVSFAPTRAGAQNAPLVFTTDSGTVSLDLRGTATSPGLGASPAALDFGSVATGSSVTLSASFTNTGTSALSITSVTTPATPFSVGGLPAVGTVIQPGASVVVSVVDAPTQSGTQTGTLTLGTTAGSTALPLTAKAVSGAPVLSIKPAALSFGNVSLGGTATKTFDISNSGNTPLTITKAAPPAGPFGAGTPISEGLTLAPGQVVHQAVTFIPTATGPAAGDYLISSNDGTGAHDVRFTGTGVASMALPAPAGGAWRLNGSAVVSGGDVVLTPAGPDLAGSVVYPTAVATKGLHARFTTVVGGGGGADGMTFALLDPASPASSVGGTGGALGFSDLSGVAVSVDTYQNPGDPSANFLGVTTGARSSNGDASASYVATAPSPVPLRTGTHVVDVTVTSAGHVVVLVDGTKVLDVAVSVPVTALPAFTAGTGGLSDVHTIRKVSLTATG